MADQFPHSSRAGHHGLTLGSVLMTYLGALASAFVPGDEHYPSGAEAQVSTFVQDRASERDVALLQQLHELWPASCADEARSALTEMETKDPESFAYLRELVYHGYYSSRRVLAAMSDRGYAYHGAPQPLGYRITDTMRLPTPRGAYVATEEVTRAAD